MISSWITRSTHFRQGSFSLTTCFFTMASNAKSGVKSPVLKASEPGGRGDKSERNRARSASHRHGPGSRDSPGHGRSGGRRPVSATRNPPPRAIRGPHGHARLEQGSRDFCCKTVGTQEVHRAPVTGTNKCWVPITQCRSSDSPPPPPGQMCSEVSALAGDWALEPMLNIGQWTAPGPSIDKQN